VAALLASRGKKVLMVDFDLEAPGLTTMSICDGASQSAGLVEFVLDYVKNGSVPDVKNYICSSEVKNPALEGVGGSLSIDVMPSGKLDPEYPQKFAAIDWPNLYSKLDGFLLMEDMRAQWQAAGYDYVLIDSRTGLTDVGGICTRQLPDAVINVFFPNEQNLNGLKQVVNQVRDSKARGTDIKLLFVASRVPRLDDEYGVLKSWLSRFQHELAYSDDQFISIDHYDSLMLLDQEVFVICRPNSKLASQYGLVAEAISTLNSEDADGVLGFIKSLKWNMYSSGNFSFSSKNKGSSSDAQGRLDEIGRIHANDCVVQNDLASLYLDARDLDRAGIAIDRGIAALGKSGTSAPISPTIAGQLHQKRIRLSSELNDREAIIASANAILADPAADETMILDSLVALANSDPERLPDPKTLSVVKSAKPEFLFEMASRLSAVPAAVLTAGAVAELAIDAADPQLDINLLTNNALDAGTTLIAARKFSRAIEIIDLVPTSNTFMVVAKTFNSAVAKWGASSEPDQSAFVSVIDSHHAVPKDETGPNFYQCIALSYAVLGDSKECAVNLEMARNGMNETHLRREFSCWNFLRVPKAEFETHCGLIAKFAERSGGPPEVVGPLVRHEPDHD
jgi:MinD-like ATPase involved in chromosome partitioning or flagellar assembly